MRDILCLCLTLLFVTFSTQNGPPSESVGEGDEKDTRYHHLGPQYQSTVGEVWPKPQHQVNYEGEPLRIRPAFFKFEIVKEDCDMIDEAIKRYYSYVWKMNRLTVTIEDERNNMIYASEEMPPDLKAPDEKCSGCLDMITIDLIGPCEITPHSEMDESYTIRIDTPDFPGKGVLAAPSNWGILRGLETLIQLIHPNQDYTGLQIKPTLIVDYPRFSYRSILLDTSRHFLTKKVIYENLDLMAFNKYNVFHWHIVDDQSFPYQSREFPEMSDLGSFHKYTHVYTQKDVLDIIEYARIRGIRVIPEFDSPGHTSSWGPAIKGLLTPCYGKDGKPDGTFGPIDPTNEDNYVFLKKFFGEVASVFKDKYLHLGGDEVDYKCWKSNPKITEFMEMRNISGDYARLEEIYMQNLVQIVQDLPQKNSYVVWQEVYDNGVEIDKSTIIHVWKGDMYGDYKVEMFNVTSSGYSTLLSACWYLNYISYGIDWQKYYLCDPQDFQGTDEQKRLVIGGGATMWGEFVDSTNVITRLWPRASLPAERLWSDARVVSVPDAAARLEEHRCRLLDRGYKIQPPNGPGYCLGETFDN